METHQPNDRSAYSYNHSSCYPLLQKIPPRPSNPTSRADRTNPHLRLRPPRACRPPIQFQRTFPTSPIQLPKMSFAARCCARAVRPAAVKFACPAPAARRWYSDAAPTAPVDPKIKSIVDEISTLTLLQTAELVTSLKVCFLIPNSMASTWLDPGDTCLRN